jgi:ABC-type sugar transport system substrate-binding protein
MSFSATARLSLLIAAAAAAAAAAVYVGRKTHARENELKVAFSMPYGGDYRASLL